MANRELIVIGASAGGIEAMRALVARLPDDLDAAVLVVVHISPTAPSVLPRILTSAGRLPAVHAADGDRIVRGRIYVAPPDRHLLVDDGVVRVVFGPRENGVRPAVDPLFRTAARFYGNRVIGVVLSGTLDCGSAGLVAIKRAGGLALVQDPDDAGAAEMPRNALAHVEADHVMAASSLGALLGKLSRQEVPDEGRRHLRPEDELVTAAAMGTPSGFSCPECAGVLNEVQDPSMLRFRCRVGHAWGSDALRQTLGDSVETALWEALRALEEKAALARRMAARARELHQTFSATRHDERAANTEEQARLVRVHLRGLDEEVRARDHAEPAGGAKGRST